MRYIVHKGWWSDEMSRALEYIKTLKHLKLDAYMQADSYLDIPAFFFFSNFYKITLFALLQECLQRD